MTINIETEIKDWKDKLCNKLVKYTDLKYSVVDIFMIKDIYWDKYCVRFITYSIILNKEVCYEDFRYSEIIGLADNGSCKSRNYKLEIL